MTDFPSFIRQLPEIEFPLPGVWGHLVQGEAHQVVFVGFDKDTDVPEHSHRAQWEIVMAGEVRLRTPDGERTAHAGDSFYLPEGTPHSAHVSAGYRGVIVFDEPGRYRVKG